MIAVAVNGRDVIVPEGFDQALLRYAAANFKQGATKKKDAANLTELRKEENKAWQAIYTELGNLLAQFENEIVTK